MRRVGTVDRVAQGLALARSEDPPDEGETVVDESLAEVGRVVSVFGPVDRPYVAVDPEGPAADLFDQVLYVR